MTGKDEAQRTLLERIAELEAENSTEQAWRSAAHFVHSTAVPAPVAVITLPQPHYPAHTLLPASSLPSPSAAIRDTAVAAPVANGATGGSENPPAATSFLHEQAVIIGQVAQGPGLQNCNAAMLPEEQQQADVNTRAPDIPLASNLVGHHDGEHEDHPRSDEPGLYSELAAPPPQRQRGRKRSATAAAHEAQLRSTMATGPLVDHTSDATHRDDVVAALAAGKASRPAAKRQRQRAIVISDSSSSDSESDPNAEAGAGAGDTGCPVEAANDVTRPRRQAKMAQPADRRGAMHQQGDGTGPPSDATQSLASQNIFTSGRPVQFQAEQTAGRKASPEHRPPGLVRDPGVSAPASRHPQSVELPVAPAAQVSQPAAESQLAPIELPSTYPGFRSRLADNPLGALNHKCVGLALRRSVGHTPKD
jgi:hypothetical protein